MRQSSRLFLALLLFSGCPPIDNDMGGGADTNLPGGVDASGEPEGAAAIGTLCDVKSPVPAGGEIAVFNAAAAECPSRICLKPALSPDIPQLPTTGPLCSADCTTDSDCAGGSVRSPDNPRTTSCAGGFVCAVPFAKGALCCRKLCVCKDFTGDEVRVPDGCQTPAEVATCNQQSP